MHGIQKREALELVDNKCLVVAWWPSVGGFTEGSEFLVYGLIRGGGREGEGLCEYVCI